MSKIFATALVPPSLSIISAEYSIRPIVGVPTEKSRISYRFFCYFPKMLTLAERTHTIIAKFGDSPNKIAHIAGIKGPSVYDWLNGRTKNLAARPARKLSEHYKLSMKWLTDGVGPMVIDEPEKNEPVILTDWQKNDAERLKKIFEIHKSEYGLSMEDLSIHLGYDTNIVRMYINGEIPLTLDFSVGVAEKFACRVSDFSINLQNKIDMFSSGMPISKYYGILEVLEYLYEKSVDVNSSHPESVLRMILKFLKHHSKTQRRELSECIAAALEKKRE